MNKIFPVSTEYITPSRTIESLNIQNSRCTRLVYIYHYEGIHFRFFDNFFSILDFLQTGKEPEFTFLTEKALDDFLKSYKPKKKS